jgi:hypothetical protein
VTFVRSLFHEGRVQSVRFSPDGRYLAAILEGSRRRNAPLVIFDVETGKRTW